MGEAAKDGKEVYHIMAREQGGQFMPFVLESHGRFGPSAWKVIGAMAERAADLSPFPREDERFFGPNSLVASHWRSKEATRCCYKTHCAKPGQPRRCWEDIIEVR